jgi:hypothetical protein
MIKLDVSYFGRRDTCDFLIRDIDHRCSPWSPLLRDASRYAAPRRYPHSLSAL